MFHNSMGVEIGKVRVSFKGHTTSSTLVTIYMHRCLFYNNNFFVLHHLRADKKMTTVFVRTIRYVQVVYVAANIIIIIIIIIIYLFSKMEKYS